MGEGGGGGVEGDMDVQRGLKLTNIQELSALPEQVTMSPTAEIEEHDKNRCKSKRASIDLHQKGV